MLTSIGLLCWLRQAQSTTGSDFNRHGLRLRHL